MKYAIIESNKCTFIDDDRQRLVDTLLFLPEKTEADIVELTDDAVVLGYDGAFYLAGFEPEIPADVAMAQAKSDRAEAVSRITVEVDGMVFDGDKTAQQNMSEAVITAMSIGVKEINAQYKQAYESGELVGEYRYIPYEELTTPWVLADNTVATVTVGQLERALGQAKMQLTPLWIKPYQPEEPVSEEVSDGATDE